MCFPKTIIQGKTVEEIVAANSANMNDKEKAQYFYELNQSIFALLGKIDIDLYQIPVQDWISAATRQYPTLTDIKIADSTFQTTGLSHLKRILERDWSNLVPYIKDFGDCDKFAARLYNHLCDYYEINAAPPVWGNTDGGYHGFNLAVIVDGGILIARLIEPQTDDIFIEDGPLGKYIPRQTALELGIKRINI